MSRAQHFDACVVVPALDAAATLEGVLSDLGRVLDLPIVVVDDGSRDDTAKLAARAGAMVERHPRNLGKGAALLTGLRHAARAGRSCIITVDADGQHPALGALAVLEATADPSALVLGVRDLVRDAAPRLNRVGNAVSNFFVSGLGGQRLRDTQCGLRRYPVTATLALGTRTTGYEFEAEVVLRALAQGVPVVEAPVSVFYPQGEMRSSHYRAVRDTARIVATVTRTFFDVSVAR